MTTIQITGSQTKSNIIIGEKISGYQRFVAGKRAVVVTDVNVQRLYGQHWNDLPVIVTEPGEATKNLQTIDNIIRRLLGANADRNTFLLGVGGGIVCDIAGFTASVFMRGIRFGFIPTTLLAQVDASVGGKNGVNSDGFKNMIGVFNQPDFVICDPEVLLTLPKEEISNGFAEIIKHAIIKDEELFSFLEKNSKSLLSLEQAAIGHVIETSVKIKADIVNQDEKEQGSRRLLNFGHTFGHAVEKITGLSHGKSVSLGMVIASKLAYETGHLHKNDFERIKNLLLQFNLPVEADPVYPKIVETLIKDKKHEAGTIHFILPQKPGSAIIQDLPLEKIVNFHF